MTKIYQLKIELAGSEPLIWRRVQVPSVITLVELHHVIQAVMGWEDCHLHQYDIGGHRYLLPGEDSLEGGIDERRKQLSKLISSVNETFRYEYDFGDGWEHLITVEAIESPSAYLEYPVCLDGEQACPPEDCGGIWRYNDIRKAFTDPKHEEHSALVEWLGYYFEPSSFDRNMANRALCGRVHVLE